MDTQTQTDGVVVLAVFTSDDAPILCAADHDLEHRRRFDFPGDFVPSVEHSQNVIARWERERLCGERFPFAVRDARSAELLGGCELQPHGNGVANLSYWTCPGHRGRGVATRAVALVCRIAFQVMGLERLEALIDPDNVGSIRIATRHGFRSVGEREGRIVFWLERISRR